MDTSGIAPDGLASRVDAERSGSLCLSCGWLKGPPSDRCACGEVAFRPNERSLAQYAAGVRRNKRYGKISLISIIPGMVVGIAAGYVLGVPALGSFFMTFTSLLIMAVLIVVSDLRLTKEERALLAPAPGAERRPVWRSLSFGISLVVFALYFIGRADPSAWALDPVRLRAGEVSWSLLSALVMHTSLVHVLGNAGGLMAFGPAVELRVGRAAFAMLLASCGVASMLAYAFSGAMHPVLGLSGAVYGIAGASLVLMPKRPNALHLFGSAMLVPNWVIIGVIVGLYTTLDVKLSLRVAWQGHLGGFLLGSLLAFPMRRLPKTEQFEASETQRTAELRSMARDLP